MVLSPREELEIIKDRIRAGLVQHGTDVAANERDPEGDGDQSVIVTPGHRQFYRNIFSEGGDFAEYFGSGLASAFAVHCVAGNVLEVKVLLDAADQPHRSALQPYASPRLISLLETRETSMRISPILMMDVCGKTVCHYGAGSMATEMTRSVVKLCAQAYQTSYLFNQEVELVGLGDMTVECCDRGTILCKVPRRWSPNATHDLRQNRQCNFDYAPELSGFEEIRAKIAAEPAFQGRKTYMEASFDANGDCTLYPATAKLKKW